MFSNIIINFLNVNKVHIYLIYKNVNKKIEINRN